MKFASALSLAAASLTSTLAAQDVQNYDVVVYGGTSGGVTASLQAAKMGKTVVLIEPTKFLGGLTTGGLGATDIGNKKAIGGMSREFYHRIWQHYQDDKSWRQQTREQYFANRPHGNSATENTMWTFEPHVATKVYDTWIAEAKIPVVFGERLDLKSGVKKDGARITEIIMESGKRFSGKMFIDATYEGDLMAEAGVKYHVGREANATYGETLNGVQVVRSKSHQFKVEVDPYVVPGDPKSGVIAGVQTDGPGEEGAGDHRVQAYNFRMCSTSAEENRIPWPKPANYDEKHFELALRNVEAGDDRISWAPTPMPNRKTDTNNNFAVSTDNIGMNYEYPDADYAKREKIVQEHRDYQMGLMWTYANHPRVPEQIRAAFARLGLCKDEFADSGHWPRQLYVREARRMIGDYVMAEKNCRRLEVVEDSVGMGAYNMDSHNVQRYITKEGKVRNEGDVQVGVRP
ncbi:MAG: FAD-dependent oxidoreductase, partial [Roseimicrobium sp.]